METKKSIKGKFDLEKFEVAKLKNLHLVKGGKDETGFGDSDEDPTTGTETSKNCYRPSTIKCL